MVPTINELMEQQKTKPENSNTMESARKAQGGRGWLVMVSALRGLKACRDIWAMRGGRAEGSEERPTGQETDRQTDMGRMAGCISAQDFNEMSLYPFMKPS